MTDDNIDKINLRLEKLREYLSILKDLKGVTAQQLEKNVDKRAKGERYLQLAIEACLDIAELVIVDQRLPTPQSASEAIKILGEHNIIDTRFSHTFSKIAGFRNILIHDYMKIDYKKVADKINKRLSDFEKYAQQIAKFLS